MRVALSASVTLLMTCNILRALFSYRRALILTQLSPLWEYGARILWTLIEIRASRIGVKGVE